MQKAWRKGRFIGIDQDADAIKAAGERLKASGEGYDNSEQLS